MIYGWKGESFNLIAYNFNRLEVIGGIILIFSILRHNPFPGNSLDAVQSVRGV
jgi:hypothetical protein